MMGEEFKCIQYAFFLKTIKCKRSNASANMNTNVITLQMAKHTGATAASFQADTAER
jgi:hypothetical protein